MSIATSIFLIAAGAILRYAVNLDSDVISIPTVGLILMIAGGAGLAFSLLYELMHTRPPRDESAVPRRDEVGPDDRTRRLR
ncbi:MAG: hypothetical protein ACXWW8_04100 [Solirubrobacterales bacterium]